MKIVLTLIILLIMSTGCSKKEEVLDTKEDLNSGSFQAIVVSQQGEALMVVANHADKGFARFEPVWVHASDDLTVTMGDLVEIEYSGGLAECYPTQIGADKITVVKKAEGKWPATSDIPDDYTKEEAVRDRCFVVTLEKTESEDLLLRFLDNSQNGIVSYLRKVSYTIEGDPIITDFLFDGKKYYIFEDDTRDKFGSGELYKKEYLYINTYEKDNTKELYFANRNDITNTEFEKSRVSSNSNDLIDTYPLYSGISNSIP